MISGLRNLGLRHEILSAAEANSRFDFLKLPSHYMCAIEEDAGILISNKALDAFHVSLVCTNCVSVVGIEGLPFFLSQSPS